MIPSKRQILRPTQRVERHSPRRHRTLHRTRSAWCLGQGTHLPLFLSVAHEGLRRHVFRVDVFGVGGGFDRGVAGVALGTGGNEGVDC